MAIRLLLIRHAESTDNLQGRFSGLRNVGLTKNGINQAEKLSLRLQNTKVDEIYCSNLERAKHTAEIVFKNRGLKKDDLFPEHLFYLRICGKLDLAEFSLNHIRSAHRKNRGNPCQRTLKT